MTFAATVLTLHPGMFPGPLGQANAGRALEGGLWGLKAVNIRSFATDRHGTVDDTPAGGGPGMVMRVDVLARAVDAALAEGPPGRPLWCMSARGERLTQARLRDVAAGPGIILLCGRFEGIDERLFSARPMVHEVSLGDFILAGGETAALAVLDGIVRLLPGVMGAAASAEEESFEAGLLEYPHYTRPQVFEDLAIPPVLTGGDHAKIAAWRRAEAERLTAERRPDLWQIHLAGRKEK